MEQAIMTAVRRQLVQLSKILHRHSPDGLCCRAFTSRMIIQKLKERDGYHVDTIEEALDCAVKDGIQRLILQPTHLMDGNEYMKVAEMADAWQTKFECLAIGVPLLYSESDIQSVIQVITEDTKSFNDGGRQFV